jgi:hypothetical protein
MPFGSLAEMENAEWATVARVDQNMVQSIQCDSQMRANNLMFVRTTAVPPNADIRFYDWCAVQVAVVGVPTPSVDVGELWIEFTCELYKPVLNAGQLGRTIVTQSYRDFGAIEANPGNALGPNNTMIQGTTNTIPTVFYNAAVVPAGTYLQTFAMNKKVSGVPDSFYFPSWLTGGTYLITIIWANVTAATISFPAITYLGNFQGQAASLWSPIASAQCQTPQNAETGDTVMQLTFVGYMQPGPQNTLNGFTLSVSGGFPSGASGTVQLIVTQVNDNFSLQS